ncbi:MAG: hypothetical protein M3P08_12740 [Thermoproteota archaeon]|jgi:hypothetical protein|nr:hypothetical protein [Thermoproteota archaeon]
MSDEEKFKKERRENKISQNRKSPRKSSLCELPLPINKIVQEIIRRDGFLSFQVEAK